MKRKMQDALQAGQLRDIDLRSALFINNLAEKPSGDLMLATALASRAVGEGHICLPLQTVAGDSVFTPEISCQSPELTEWRQNLLESGVVGEPGSAEPLILDENNKLYFARYHRCERVIARELLKRSTELLQIDLEEAKKVLGRLFPTAEKEDWQKIAAAASVLKKFVVISGGPGTGKTTTVARILALLQSMAEGSLRIALVAPTGKAAVRLQESILSAREFLDENLAEMVPVETQTLHRLLGYMPGKKTFRYNSANRLTLDLLVIDEASMIDVPLMAALLEALPEQARIIMLGDQNQLTSVEAGSLFGDICSLQKHGWSSIFCDKVKQLTGWSPESVSTEETLADCIVLLRKSYRFAENEGISALAQAVNENDSQQLKRLRGQDLQDLVFVSENLHNSLEEYFLAGFAPCFKVDSPLEALGCLDNFRVLCAVREGPYGVEGINRHAGKILRKHGYIKGSGQWYQGRPVIIRKNHYALRLFNGDTGIVWPDTDGKLWAWFSLPDGSLHKVSQSRLPEHDSAFAITVHQSQGSEFLTAIFLLPETDSRVLCRELLYTGITRARDRLLLFSDPALIEKVINRRVVRYSGLKDKLWHTG